jgi:translocation and assembly module TamB
MGTSTGSNPPASAFPLGQKTRLHVRITSAPDLRLDSRGLSFLANVDATIGGTAAHPAPSGDIRLLSGEAFFAGNRYQILRGDIELAHSVNEPPLLDIETQTRVDRYDLTISINGPADRPRLAYSSDPPLPTSDILSLLALGYTPQEQLMTSTGNPLMGTVGASALLSQALSSQVSGRVQSLFGITRISIDPNLLGPSTAGGTRITIEKEVSHNLTITYSTNTGATQQEDIRLRWDLSDKISLVGERDINDVYSVEVLFRRTLLK